MVENVIYQNILESIKDGVISLDLHGRLTTFNPAAERILGLSRSDVIGKTFVEVFLSLEGSDDFCQVILDAITESNIIHHRFCTISSSAFLCIRVVVKLPKSRDIRPSKSICC